MGMSAPVTPGLEPQSPNEPPPSYLESFSHCLVPPTFPAYAESISATDQRAGITQGAIQETNPERRRLRTTSEPIYACTCDAVKPRRSNSLGDTSEKQLSEPENKTKRSKKKKVFDRVVLGSWVILWPLYLPIILMRENPVDEDDWRKDVLLGEGYRLCKKMSSRGR